MISLTSAAISSRLATCCSVRLFEALRLISLVPDPILIVDWVSFTGLRMIATQPLEGLIAAIVELLLGASVASGMLKHRPPSLLSV